MLIVCFILLILCFSSEQENEDKVTKDLAGVEEDKGLKNLLASDSEDEEDEQKKKQQEEEKKQEENKENKKGRYLLKLSI